MENVAEIGLLKMDFLGLANLTILGEAVEIIKQTRGELLEPKDLPDGDDRTYEMLGNGETFGVFQLESAGMRRAIQQLRPESVSELAAMVALYRPGPMQHIPTFCRTKHGEEEISYPHPDLADVLDETYGVIVYQDQVLLIARQFAGYTLGEADIMRKAMGKKIAEKMRAERERFKRGAAEKGYTEEDDEKIFDLIEPFAGYAFNKAHAVCYGSIAYQTAYLKANYPAEYMTAVLRLAPSHPSGTAARVAAAIAECTKLGIQVLGPDINRSGVNFDVEEVEGGALGIRFGLSIAKNVGESAVRAICEAREDQPEKRFSSFEALCNAVDYSHLNKRVMESLIKCGALDDLGDRAVLLARMEQVMSSAQAFQKARQRGQMDLFGAASLVAAPEPAATQIVSVQSIPSKQLLAWEKEYLGTYLSSHPLKEVAQAARDQGDRYQLIADLSEELVGQQVRLLGIVAGIRKITTRTNRTMAVLQFEDLSGSTEVVLFPETWDRCGEVCVEDAILVLNGKADSRNDALQIIADDATVFVAREPATPVARRTVRVTLPVSRDISHDIQRMERLAMLLREFPGDDGLVLTVAEQGNIRHLRSSLRIDWCEDLRRAMAEILGSDNVAVTSRMEPVGISA
jgi:DNA polymerase-3 subunit alpha